EEAVLCRHAGAAADDQVASMTSAVPNLDGIRQVVRVDPDHPHVVRQVELREAVRAATPTMSVEDVVVRRGDDDAIDAAARRDGVRPWRPEGLRGQRVADDGTLGVIR